MTPSKSEFMSRMAGCVDVEQCVAENRTLREDNKRLHTEIYNLKRHIEELADFIKRADGTCNRGYLTGGLCTDDNRPCERWRCKAYVRGKL